MLDDTVIRNQIMNERIKWPNSCLRLNGVRNRSKQWRRWWQQQRKCTQKSSKIKFNEIHNDTFIFIETNKRKMTACTYVHCTNIVWCRHCYHYNHRSHYVLTATELLQSCCAKNKRKRKQNKIKQKKIECHTRKMAVIS